jgi:hypothetical protein
MPRVPPIEFLQSWYLAQCNGEWEHVQGVTIETLDNPGWMVTIDLLGTALEDQPMVPLRAERAPNDWLVCEVDHNRFRGQGDGQKLGQIILIFERWAASLAGAGRPPR